MYIRNELLKFIIIVDKKDSLLEVLTKVLSTISTVYAYKLFDLQGTWKVEWLISKQKDYNTIKVSDMLDNICNVPLLHKAPLVTFAQPSIGLMIKLYEPLVHRLALMQVQAWQMEYDDAAQICRMVILQLYNKGYFVHKRLIIKAYNNAIYTICNKKLQEVDTVYSCDLTKDEQEMIENIPNETITDEFDLQEDITQKRQIVIAQIGQRQYDEYLRQFNNNNVTNATRNALLKIQRKLRRDD